MGDLFRGFVSLLLIVLISISLTSGLELSASTGGNDDSSSTHVVYGATVDDYANEHIGLNPGDATLSNSFSGSGSLPSSSISKSDSKGDYAQAYRSVSGKAGITTWKYDWNTYTPTSSSAGSGVGAWLSLNAQNAYSINGGSYSSNKEGDNAQADTYVGLSNLQTTSWLSNYYTQATAFTNQASASQSADYAKSTSPITIAGYSNNREGDFAKADILASTGTIYYPTIDVIATKTSDYVYPTASNIVTTGTATLDASTSDTVGDNTKFKLQVTSGSGYSGNILSPNYYALSQTALGESKLVSLKSANGLTATITSHAEDRATAQDNNRYTGGSADFEALSTNGNKFTNPTLDTKATGSGVTSTVDIASSGFPKTALLLEPFKWEFGDYYGPTDSVGSYLERKGYAVTDYSNAGVTWTQVNQLAKNTVSLIDAHGWVTKNAKGEVIKSNGLFISNTGQTALTGDPSGQYRLWSQLQPYLMNSQDKGKNSLMILDACCSFFKNPSGQLSGQDIVKNAEASGGFPYEVGITPDYNFMKTLFAHLFAGDTLSTANKAASTSVKNVEILTLQPINSNYKLK